MANSRLSMYRTNYWDTVELKDNPVFKTQQIEKRISRDQNLNQIDLFYQPDEPRIKFNESSKLYKPIIKKLTESSMIIFYGDMSTRNDRNQFARSIAHRLKKAFAGNLKICEWRKNTDVYDIPIFLTEEARGIYILTDISPRMVHYNLHAIETVVRRKSHFLLITTNNSLSTWNKVNHRSLFHELTTEGLYSSDDLAVELVHLLYDSKLSLPVEIRKEFISSYEMQQEYKEDLGELISFRIGEKLTIKDIANRLRNHDDIKAFVRLLKERQRTKRPTIHIDTESAESAKRHTETVEEQRIFDIGDFPAQKLQQDTEVERGGSIKKQDSRTSVTETDSNILSDAMIEKIIEHILSTDWSLTKWFLQLEKEDKYLLVGATLLSGLYQNQLFTALEDLVENEWRIRDPSLAAFDYEELETLMDYAVARVETGKAEDIIEVKSGLRREVFQECWYHEQRLIVNSIQGLINLVKNSIEQQGHIYQTQPFEVRHEDIDRLIQLNLPPYIIEKIQLFIGKKYDRWNQLIHEIQEDIGSKSFKLFRDQLGVVFDYDILISDDEEYRAISRTAKITQLYGTNDKAILLRRVIGTALRQIAYESLPLAEEALFYLASTTIHEMRVLAAMSLAQWKEKEKNANGNQKYAKQLYEILNRWYKEPEKVYDPFGAGLSPEKRKFINDAQDRIHITIVITIGFAASYDDPNNCSPELFKLLRNFIPPAKRVAPYLGNTTVPLLLKYHLKQLHENSLLYDLMLYTDSANYIAYELSLAYIKKPDLFNDIIEEMYTVCDQLKLQHKGNQKKIKKLEKQGKEIIGIQSDKAYGPYRLRKRLMSILISVFGLLQFTDREGQFNAQGTFDRLADIYKNESKEPDLQNAVADAVRQQIKRDFPNIENEIISILEIFDLIHLLQVIPGLLHQNKYERADLEKRLAKKRKEAIMLANFDEEIDEKRFDSERDVTDIESVMFSWIFSKRFKFRQFGFIALFFLFRPELFSNRTPEQLKSDIEKKVRFKLFKKLLIPSLCSLRFRVKRIVRQLLPATINLAANFPQEMWEMLRIWSHKLTDRKLNMNRETGRALSKALWLANHFFVAVFIHIAIIGALIWIGIEYGYVQKIISYLNTLYYERIH